MSLYRILLIFASTLVVLTVCADVRQGGVLLSKENLELTPAYYSTAFKILNKGFFYQFKYYTLLFQRVAIATSMDDKEPVKMFMPICLVKLLQGGIGLLVDGEECVQRIEDAERIDPRLRSLELAYRCYDSYDDSVDNYKLRLAHFEPPFQSHEDRSTWMISFTPKDDSDDGCHPIFLEDIGDKEELAARKDAKGDNDDLVSLDKALPLTKQHFEETIPLPEVFHSNRQLTYIYMRDEKDRENRLLQPIKKCIVSMFEKGKGMVHPGCADKMMLEKKLAFTKNFKNLLLPLRCFYHDNALDYELQTTSIDRLEYEEDQYVIYFQVPESDHCSPKWGSNEDLGKTDDEEEYNFEADIIKDEL